MHQHKRDTVRENGTCYCSGDRAIAQAVVLGQISIPCRVLHGGGPIVGWVN